MIMAEYNLSFRKNSLETKQFIENVAYKERKLSNYCFGHQIATGINDKKLTFQTYLTTCPDLTFTGKIANVVWRTDGFKMFEIKNIYFQHL